MSDYKIDKGAVIQFEILTTRGCFLAGARILILDEMTPLPPESATAPAAATIKIAVKTKAIEDIVCNKDVILSKRGNNKRFSKCTVNRVHRLDKGLEMG